MRQSLPSIRWGCFQPGRDLAPWVDRHVHVEWSLEEGRIHRQKFPPLLGMVAWFEGEEAWLQGLPRRGESRSLEGRGEIWACVFRPGAAAAFFGIEAWRLSGRRLALGGRSVDDRERGVAAGMPESPAQLEERIRALRVEGASRTPLAAKLLDEARSEGAERIQEWADRVGMDVRGLQRLFRREVGVPPKEYLVRRRLLRAAWALRFRPDRKCGEVAVQVGCSDQAHFTREFRSVFGRTPDVFRREPGLPRPCPGRAGSAAGPVQGRGASSQPVRTSGKLS